MTKVDLNNERYEGMLLADGLDDAIIGTAAVWGKPCEVFVYSTSKVLDILMERDGMSYEDATEFFEFNIAGSYVGETTPIWVDDIE